VLDPENLQAEVDRQYDEMVDIRRWLHRHPELGFHEVDTTALVRERLSALGLEELPLRLPTGAAFRLIGHRPGRPVVLRADLDALAVTEATAVPFSSETPGRMHACGHDAHTATLLVVAQLLASRVADLSGRYLFVFQPAEEVLGGAVSMLEAGVLEGFEGGAVVGYHVTSQLPVKTVAMRAGVAMAEVHVFTVVVSGPGGHGAMVRRTGDVVRAVGQIAVELPSVVAGLEHEGVQCACSAGQVAAGTAPNVVPDQARLWGTLRTFTTGQREVALERLDALCRRLGEDHGVAIELEVLGSAPAVVNDPSVTAVAQDVARSQLGDRGVIVPPPVTPSDDVSHFLERLPGCYFLVGGALADGSSGPHHSPRFAIDEEAMRVAASILTTTAVRLGTG
jgi:amidohydrolase